MGSKTKVKTKTKKKVKNAESGSKPVTKKSTTIKKSTNSSQKRSKKEKQLLEKIEKIESRKRKIERKQKNPKKTKRTKKTGDFRNILEYQSNEKDMRNVEKKLRERLRKRKEEEEEDELLKSSSLSSSSEDSNSGSDTSSVEDSSTSSEASANGSENDEDVKEAFDLSRRASVIASSNVNPSDGDDEDSIGGSSEAGSMASNRSRLSSGSKASSLTAARNQASKKTIKNEQKKLRDYDMIERQLMADQEKELEYLNGLDQPINKADLPLLVEPDANGPPMNEPMKLRISRLKRTKIWVRSIPSVPPLLHDEVDEFIARQKRLKEIEENDFEAIFDATDTPTTADQARKEKTLEIESNLKMAILARLKKSQPS